MWMGSQQGCMRKYVFDKPGCGRWVIQGDVIRNGVEVAQCRLGPDYLSHRAILRLACLSVRTRPSWIARSPRPIISRTANRLLRSS